MCSSLCKHTGVCSIKLQLEINCVYQMHDKWQTINLYGYPWLTLWKILCCHNWAFLVSCIKGTTEILSDWNCWTNRVAGCVPLSLQELEDSLNLNAQHFIKTLWEGWAGFKLQVGADSHVLWFFPFQILWIGTSGRLGLGLHGSMWTDTGQPSDVNH